MGNVHIFKEQLFLGKFVYPAIDFLKWRPARRFYVVFFLYMTNGQIHQNCYLEARPSQMFPTPSLIKCVPFARHSQMVIIWERFFGEFRGGCACNTRMLNTRMLGPIDQLKFLIVFDPLPIGRWEAYCIVSNWWQWDVLRMPVWELQHPKEVPWIIPLSAGHRMIMSCCRMTNLS